MDKETVYLDEETEYAKKMEIIHSDSEGDPNEDPEIRHDRKTEKYLDMIYDQYMAANEEYRKKLSKKEKNQERKKQEIPEDLTNFSKFSKKYSVEDELEMYDDKPDNELLMAPNEVADKRASIWFDSDLFNNIEGENEDEEAINKMLQEKLKRKRESQTKSEEELLDAEPQVDNPASKKRKIGPEHFVQVKSHQDSDKEDIGKPKKLVSPYDVDNAEFEEVPPTDHVDDDPDDYEDYQRAEMLALGTLLNNPVSRNEVVDKTINKYMFPEDYELPAWFKDDENKHNKVHMPITKEMMAQYKEDLKAINARTTKKVAEAKARKRKKYVLKLEKARTKAKAIVANAELSEREKVKQIQKLYKGQLNKVKPQKIYVVGRRKVVSSKIPRGKNVRLKVVDLRLKKDKRAKKASEKRKKMMRRSKKSK